MNFKKKRGNSSMAIDTATFDYYKRIDGLLRDEEMTNDSKGELVSNMFSQLCQEAVAVCKCPQTCPIIQTALTKASANDLNSLLDVFSSDWDSICKDKCSSHIVQTALMVMPKLIVQTLNTFNFEEAEASSPEGQLILTVVQLSKHILEAFDESIKDSHVSHVLRALFQVLGGTNIKDTQQVQKSKSCKQYQKRYMGTEEQSAPTEVTFDNYNVPVQFKALLKKFYKRLFKLQDFGVYMTESISSPVIQTLLHVLHRVDDQICQKAIHKLIKQSRIKETGSNTNLPPVVADNAGSYLIQAVVSLCTEDTFAELYTKLFKGKFLQYANHQNANFVLQNMIKACRWSEKDQFMEMVEELSECSQQVFASRKYGVLVAMAETAARLGVGQPQLLQALLEAFQCCEPVDRRDKCAKLMLMCTSYDSFYGNQEETTGPQFRLQRTNYHGSLLLQHLLLFSDTGLLEASLLSLESADVTSLACDPCGSHVIDAFFKSKSLKMSSKKAMIGKMAGAFLQLACNRNGSRTLEAVWENIELKLKSRIATELCQQENRVRSDQFGRHLFRKFGLTHFSKRNSDWADAQKMNAKKRDLFKDFLNEGEPSAKKKKKNKNRGQADS